MNKQRSTLIEAKLTDITATYEVLYDIIPPEPDIGINGGVHIEFVYIDGDEISETLTDREFTMLADALVEELFL